MKTGFALRTSMAVLVLLWLSACASQPRIVDNHPPGPTAQPAAPPPPIVPPPPPAPPPPPVPPAPPAEISRPADPAPATASASSLSPAATEILRLKDAGYSEDFLLNRVRRDNQSYRLTVDDLVALRRAGLSETVIDAMAHAGPAAAVAESPQPVARHAEFDGLVRQQQGFLGIGASKRKNVGKLVVDAERVSWFQMTDAEDNFSLAERSIKEMWLNCAPRAGENFCLEVCFKSYSGKEGCFRDAGWENGENRQVLSMYDYFQKAFPTTFFSRREKKTF